ncbi:virulence protein [Shewanella sp. D64]|uniref:virulence protein n=1 Tax=unclassified Shewanella TaxID=196818 RepID=UPI0022BA136D|nr:MULTISPECIES: virulence protein [unclassified Shewanella]MEC4727425.1 virulence protein [Shewanella sp. D64]MEC4739580.1 virulence protein [Shewanella sp. E94]WBJ96037.1 virulence protein [Shewanella sp. MTB7]
MQKVCIRFSLLFTLVLSGSLNAIERERVVGEKYNRTFPIWAQEAIDLGHELPKPYGFSLNYMNMDQPLVVDSVSFSGLGTLDEMLSIKGSEAVQDSETLTLRGDVWVLPFLNLYGVIGHTKGSSVANVQLEADWSSLLPPWMCTVNPCNATSDPFGFVLDFKGTTYGVGGTIVGGIGNWFALLDVNYTNTNLNILDGEISSIVVSPRAGYRTSYNKHDIQIWIGTMYQNVEQTFSGNMRDIGFPLGDAKFEVNQHLEDKWNGLLGSQVGLTKNIDLLVEFGIGTRSSFMMSLGYRF